MSARTESNHIVIEWSDSYEGVEEYTVHRAVGDEAFRPIGSVNNTTYIFRDYDVEHGTTYQYQVTASIDGNETTPCDRVEATAVPVFGTLLTGGLATILGVAAYSVAQRRRS